MTNTLPILGRLAVVTFAGVATGIGMATDVSCGITADIEKAYVMNSQAPVMVQQGNQSYPVSFSRLFIDSTYAADVLAGTPIDVVVYPKGTTLTGSPKITLGQVVFGKWQLKATDKGYIGEDVGGEAATFAVSTV